MSPISFKEREKGIKKVNLLKGIITYIKPDRAGTSTRFRLGMRTWCSIKGILPKEYFAAFVSSEGTWMDTVRQRCLVVKDIRVYNPFIKRENIK